MVCVRVTGKMGDAARSAALRDIESGAASAADAAAILCPRFAPADRLFV